MGQIRKLLLKMLDTSGATDGDAVVYSAALGKWIPGAGGGSGGSSLFDRVRGNWDFDVGTPTHPTAGSYPGWKAPNVGGMSPVSLFGGTGTWVSTVDDGAGHKQTEFAVDGDYLVEAAIQYTSGYTGVGGVGLSTVSATLPETGFTVFDDISAAVEGSESVAALQTVRIVAMMTMHAGDRLTMFGWKQGSATADRPHSGYLAITRLTAGSAPTAEEVAYITLQEQAVAPADPPASDWRFFVDSTETVPLLKAIDSTGTVIPYWPIYVIPNGGTPPSDLHPKVIILEEGP